MGRATPAGDADGLKTSWPEVVGWPVLNAAFQINSDRPDVSVAFYMQGTALPTDRDPKRVDLTFDVGNVVVATPVVG